MNVIRVKLPSGTKRFKPFSVSDYRDFLLVSVDIRNNPEEEQLILDELLEEIYPDEDPVFREFIFLNVLISSIGKSRLPLVFTCPTCGKDKRMLLNLGVKALEPIELETSGLKIKFNYVKPSDDYADTFIRAIESVEDSNGVYKWEDLNDENRESVIDSISFEDFEKVIREMRTIRITQRIGCCEQHELNYDRLLPIFKLMVNPDEMFTFYRVNHLLTKANYSISDLMAMVPVERGIALSLVEKDVKEASNAKSRVS